MFQQYAQMEGPLNADYDKWSGWLGKFSDPNINWEDYTKAPDMQSYIQEHKTDIDDVVKFEGIITQIGTHLDKEHKELNGVLDQFQIWDYVSKVAMRELSEENVYKELDDRTKAKFDKFDDMVKIIIHALLFLYFFIYKIR